MDSNSHYGNKVFDLLLIIYLLVYMCTLCNTKKKNLSLQRRNGKKSGT